MSCAEMHGTGMKKILFLVIYILFSNFSYCKCLHCKGQKVLSNVLIPARKKKRTLLLIGIIQFCHVVDRSLPVSLLLSFTLPLQMVGEHTTPD